MKKSRKPEKSEFSAATEIFHAYKEDLTYSSHQKSYRLALLYLESHVFHRMQEERWQLGTMPFERVRQIVDTLVTSAGEWGTSMYSSQTRAAAAPTDDSTQLPFEFLWRELGVLEAEGTSRPRQAFDAVFAARPLLSSLLDYCVDYLEEILSEQFPELKEYPDLVRELLDIHVWTCARLEFIYSLCVPVLKGREGLIEKAFEFNGPEDAAGGPAHNGPGRAKEAKRKPAAGKSAGKAKKGRR